MKFEKGKSGNPATQFSTEYQPTNRGRKPGTSLSTYLKEFGEAEHIEYTIKVHENGKERVLEGELSSPKENLYTALAAILWRKALTGDLAAIREITDRTEGKAVSRTEISGKDGDSLETNTIIYIPDNGRD